MNADVQKIWIEDLRAHPELQGVGELETADGKFCCLGRLCVLAVAAGVIEIDPLLERFSKFGQVPGGGLLPIKVADWAGIDPNPSTGSRNMAYMNDVGETFLTIADSIETYGVK